MPHARVVITAVMCMHQYDSLYERLRIEFVAALASCTCTIGQVHATYRGALQQRDSRITQTVCFSRYCLPW
jgi:hypothetical protein